VFSFSDDLAIVLFILGLLIGWASPHIHQWWRTRLTRKFWKNFAVIDRSRVVLGVHPGFEDFDPAGLAGVGDVRALTELQAIFVESGLGRLPTIVSVEPDEALPEDLDLVLIGSPDVNQGTKQVLLRVPGRFTFSDEKFNVSITDQKTGKVYPLDLGPDFQTDAGVIKKMPNPLDKDRQVLIIAGSFGHGTLAGVRLCRERRFLSDPRVASGQPFECLFTTEVLGDNPRRDRTEIVDFATLGETGLVGHDYPQQ
jgi:hypothetical protein